MGSPLGLKHAPMRGAYPEVNLQIPRTAKLSVSNLECDRHLIIFVKDLVEAFSLVSAHLNVMRKRGGKEAQEGGEYWEAHRGRYVEGIEMGADEALGHAVGITIVWKGLSMRLKGALNILKAGVGKSEFVGADTGMTCW